MASLQAVKRRIRSVSGTRQITRAMQLVAASKLRRAQDAAVAPQSYVTAAQEVLARLSGSPAVAKHALYRERPIQAALTIVVAGDRGMAGAYNANVLRALSEEVISRNVPQQAICVGRYAALHVAAVKGINEIAAYPLDAGDSDLELARPILKEAIQTYTEGTVDSVSIIYTRFISTVKQEVTTQQLLPVPSPSVVTRQESGDITFEPNPETLLEYATRRLLEAQLVQAMLESRAGEQAARMLAMMNATDNAGELIEDLTLAYNNARQAAITQQISEISSGAEAMNQ